LDPRLNAASSRRPLSVAAIVAITVGSLGLGLAASVRPATATTIGNTDFYSDYYNDGAPSILVSPLLGGVSAQVNQRYGCTNQQEDLTAGTANGCPPNNRWWHHGIDVSSTAHEAWYAGGSGTVVDTQYAALGIRDPNGRIVYYVHGDTYQVSKDALVSAGTYLAQASNPCIWPPNGGCDGTHLHLEVHNSEVGYLSTDDINPEPWLRGWSGTVSTVSPTGGPSAGGTSVSITGTSFAGVTGSAGVMFGASAAASYTVISGTQITAVSPAYDPGPVDITVFNNGFPSPTSSGDRFTYDRCATANFSVSPSPAQPAGTDVTVIPYSSACPSPLYRLWISFTPGVWTMLKDYSPIPLTGLYYLWKTTGLPAPLTDYPMSVWVRDTNSPGATCGSLGCYDAFASFTYKLTTTTPANALCASVTGSWSPASPQPSGTTVTVIGSAGGCPRPLYEFLTLAPGGTWTVAQAYSPSATFNWITSGPLAAGTYHISVWAKDASSGTGTYDAYLPSFTYTLTSTACASVTGSAAPASPQAAGTPITLTATAAFCPNPVYEFWILMPGFTTYQLGRGYATSPAFNWHTIGLPGGTYHYSVWARDTGSSAGYDAYFPGTAYVLTVTPCTSVTASAAPLPPQQSGTPVIFSAYASGCPNPRYEFWLLAPGGSWTIQQAYSSTATYHWTGSFPGAYNYSVWARDASSVPPAGYDQFVGHPYTLT
jgi:hypothetical protein